MKVTLSIDSKASLEISYSDLAVIIMFMDNDERNGLFFSQLFDHPANDVRCEVAGLLFIPLEKLECLSRDTSIDVVRRVASNNCALKMLEAPLILEMIGRDVGVAADIADRLGKIRESAREDVIKALLQHTDPLVLETTRRFVDSNKDSANEVVAIGGNQG